MILTVALLATIFQLLPVAAAISYGDPDKDGKINAADALFVLRAAVNKITPTAEQTEAADVDDSGKLDALDALMILQYAVKLRDDFPANMSPEEQYYDARNQEYGVDFSDFEEIATFDSLEDTADMVETLGGTPEKGGVEGYEVKNSTKLSYNPLSREAKRKGELTKYNTAEKTVGTLKVGSTTMTYSVPKNVTAYDVVPVNYTLYSSTNTLPVHIGATAFEDPARTGGKAYYDLNLPGTVAVKLSYEGHVTANNTGGKPILNPDMTKDIQGTAFPAYVTEDLVKSGTVKAADHLWFKVKFTNTGDTILDGDGNGAFWFAPVFYKYEDGGWTQTTTQSDHQMLDAVYPGESGEFWVYFGAVTPGAYRMELRGNMTSEFANEHMSSITASTKTPYSGSYEFNVTATGEMTTPQNFQNNNNKNYQRNTWLADFEEFMSSYTSLYKVGSSTGNATSGVFYVQPAPWTQTITVKLMEGNSNNLAAAAVKVNVDTDSIKLNLNPYNTNYVVTGEGTKEPMIMTQNMADMRVNVVRGPECDDIILNDLLNMKEAGINTLTTTHAYTGDYTGFYDMSMYMLDCARKLGFELEGHARYYYRDTAAITLVKKFDTTTDLGTGRDLFGTVQLDAANGILARWNLNRYGDFYYYNRETKEIPIAIEDNHGWMNSVLNQRIGIQNEYCDRLLYKWLETAYNGDLNALNTRYGTNYSKFRDITVSDQGTLSSAGHQAGLDLNDYNSPYHDWTPATMDLDIFRTYERARYANEFLNFLGVEGAKVAIRSENNIYLAGGISQTTDNAHYRRIYYEQRRAALIPEVLAASGVIYSDSSYNAWNLRPSEVYELTVQAKKTGFVSAKTPPFSRMYDDAINDVIGSIQYDDSMSLGTMQKSVTMFSMGSLFQYWKAMYEGGGIPGTMWQDYFCGLYVTTTQYKEMLFFKEKMEEMLATEEGKAWATDLPEGAESSPLDSVTRGAYSFPETYIEQKIATISRKNRIMDFLN